VGQRVAGGPGARGAGKQTPESKVNIRPHGGEGTQRTPKALKGMKNGGLVDRKFKNRGRNAGGGHGLPKRDVHKTLKSPKRSLKRQKAWTRGYLQGLRGRDKDKKMGRVGQIRGKGKEPSPRGTCAQRKKKGGRGGTEQHLLVGRDSLGSSSLQKWGH